MIYPIFAMFSLTLTVLVLLFKARVMATRQKLVSPAYFLTYSTNEREPEKALAMSRNFTNLFEAPTLFYVVCIAIIVVNAENFILIGLAWAYVIARVLHSLIHTGSNNLRWRIFSYMVSWVFLTALWIGLLVSTFGAAP